MLRLNRRQLQLREPRERVAVRRGTGVLTALAGALVAAASALVVALVLLPPALVFPVTGATLVLAAGTTALMAWVSPPEAGGARIVLWDCAGALALIGVCAALIGEPEPAVALLERERG